MKRQVELLFQGYTWEDYFYIISNKSGILVTYRGKLDNEGAVKLNEILHVAESDVIKSIYESDELKTLKKQVAANDRLFFSYSELEGEERTIATQLLRSFLLTDASDLHSVSDIRLSCFGACALFPKEILKTK